jgi:hypothetical protein
MPEFDVVLEFDEQQAQKLARIAASLVLDPEELIEMFSQASVNMLLSQPDDMLLGLMQAQLSQMRTGNG